MATTWKDPASLTAASGTVWLDPLKINGVALGDTEQLDPQVSVTPLNGSTLHRLSDGSGVKQTVWTRRKVRITCTGWVPPTISSIDFSAPVTVEGQMLAGTITGFSDGPEDSFSPQSAEWGWTLTLEEV